MTVPPTPPQHGHPDYRFTLANERTFLAWIRTGLAMLAAAVAVVQFPPSIGPHELWIGCGVLLALLAVISCAGSLVRWRANDTAIEEDRSLPQPRSTWVVAGGLGVLAVIVVLALVIRAVAS